MELLLSKVWRYQLSYLDNWQNEKILINTLNVHCFNTAKQDIKYYEALLSSNVLLPDGDGIILALRFLYGIRLHKIAGYDLFLYEMKRLNLSGGKCFFLGSSVEVLRLIKKKIEEKYPGLESDFYSPPYKPEFNKTDNHLMTDAINAFSPDVLFIGMTAPKQEKWAFEHFKELNTKHICCIGAVFDFVAGTIERSPKWMIRISLEWFYRFIKEPKRLWRRYIIGNMKFIYWVLKEKSKVINHK